MVVSEVFRTTDTTVMSITLTNNNNYKLSFGNDAHGREFSGTGVKVHDWEVGINTHQQHWPYSKPCSSPI